MLTTPPPVDPNTNDYNGSPYSNGVIEAAAQPYWDWYESSPAPANNAVPAGVDMGAARAKWTSGTTGAGGGQARWKVKPTGFRTVLRNGWYYKV